MSYGGTKARWGFTLIAAFLVAAISILYLSGGTRDFHPSGPFSSYKSPAIPEQDALPQIPKVPTPRQWPEHEVVPLHESFPEAVHATTDSDLPQVPSYNAPPAVHVPEATPLFIGFTRNWQMLQQVVISYITAGWPPEDIYVVENTGVMDSNQQHRLTEENPFYLDHHRLGLLGVNVMITPVYLTFAQLQNYYLAAAIKRKYATYFWSHMDVIAQAEEDREPYQSFYMRAVDAVREAMAPGFARDGEGREGRWSVRFFAYDWLTLVNTATHAELGGWDTAISYYKTDCDMYERMRMAHMPSTDARAGKIWDVSSVLDDLGVLYRRKPVHDMETISSEAIDIFQEDSDQIQPPPTKRSPQWTNSEDTRNSTGYHALRATLHQMQEEKGFGTNHRNQWQRWQRGGEGQPFYKDINGFEDSLDIAYKAGEAVYLSKWGTVECNLFRMRPDEAWKVNHWKDH